MIVYHGGTNIVQQPLVGVGRKELDFGQGFYLTDILEQANAWASRIAGRRMEDAIVNSYELDIEAVSMKYRYKKFDGYNSDWLHFIADNRHGREAWKQYDIIEGGVADDRVVDTVEQFIADLISEEKALERLMHYAPNNQICITNQRLVDESLSYIESLTIKTE